MSGPSPALCAEAAPILARALLDYRAAKAAAQAKATPGPATRSESNSPSDAEVA